MAEKYEHTRFPAATVEIAADGSAVLLLRIPLARASIQAYASNRIDAHLSPQEAQAMRAILLGMQAHGARLESFRLVQTSADVMRFVLRSVFKAMGQSRWAYSNNGAAQDGAKASPAAPGDPVARARPAARRGA